MPVKLDKFEKDGTTAKGGKRFYGRGPTHTNMKAVILHKNEVRAYGDYNQMLFFCLVRRADNQDEIRLMVNEKHFNEGNQGDIIEFDMVVQNEGWGKVYKNFRWKCIARGVLEYTDEIQFTANYITMLKTDKAGNLFRWCHTHLNTLSVERIYIKEEAIHKYLKKVGLLDEAMQQAIDVEGPDFDVHPRFGFSDWDARGNHQDKLFFVEEIMEIKSSEKPISREIPLSELDYHLGGASISHTQYGDEILLKIPADEFPFQVGPFANKVKHEFKGMVKVSGMFRQDGRWSQNVQQVISWWEPKTKANFKFVVNDEDLEDINVVIENALLTELEEQLYMKVYDWCHSHPLARHEDIKQVFEEKGLEMDEEEIRKLYWKKDYDLGYYIALKSLDWDDIYYSNDVFVFVSGDYVVFERPTYGAATYIFQGDATPEGIRRLWEEFLVVNKMDLRSVPSLQEEMGFIDFVIHEATDIWLRVIENKLKGA